MFYYNHIKFKKTRCGSLEMSSIQYILNDKGVRKVLKGNHFNFLIYFVTSQHPLYAKNGDFTIGNYECAFLSSLLISVVQNWILSARRKSFVCQILF